MDLSSIRSGKLALTTYSQWSAFRDCRRRAFWRYVRNLRPRTTATALDFGRIIHGALEQWHKGLPLDRPEDGPIDVSMDMDSVMGYLDRQFPVGHSPTSNPDAHGRWHLARAMLRAYASRYPMDGCTWRTVAIEHQLEGLIVNPATGASSRTFYLGGRVDGIVAAVMPELSDVEANWILEHKTAATIDAGYLDKLWTDFQTALYALYIERTLGIHITGVIYNVLAKAKLQQSAGETEAEFTARYAELCAKNRSGKSTATRKMPETDEAFAARLTEWYAAPTAFHREQLILSRDQLKLIEEELWELTQAWLDCVRRDVWYLNTSQCFLPGRTCPYYPICSSNGNPNVIGNLYEEKEPHEELDGTATPSAPSTAPSAPTTDPDWDPASLSF